MNLRDVTMALAGGAMIYGAMTACTGGETMSGAHADDGASGAAACECEPRELQADTIDCGPNGIDYVPFRVIKYPGASLDEIATSVTVLVREGAGASFRNTDYVDFADEQISVACPSDGQIRAIRAR